MGIYATNEVGFTSTQTQLLLLVSILFAVVGRFASIIGPFMWGYIVDTLGLGRPAAVASLLVFIVLAFIVLQGFGARFHVLVIFVTYDKMEVHGSRWAVAPHSPGRSGLCQPALFQHRFPG